MSRLLGFNVSKPIPTNNLPSIYTGYDPQKQTVAWLAGTAPLSAYCTLGGLRKCNAYGSYCNTQFIEGARRCDN
jgi:hypothetical protein